MAKTKIKSTTKSSSDTTVIKKPSLVKKMSAGGKVPKAKVSPSVSDNTRVKKPVLNNTKAPTYNYLKYSAQSKKPTARDSAEYRYGYNTAVAGRKVGFLDNNLGKTMGSMEGENYRTNAKGRIISKPLTKNKNK